MVVGWAGPRASGCQGRVFYFFIFLYIKINPSGLADKSYSIHRFLALRASGGAQEQTNNQLIAFARSSSDSTHGPWPAGMIISDIV
jgi:hypothetical protein